MDINDKQYTDELRLYYKLDLLKNIIKRMDISKLVVEDPANIEKAQIELNIYEYMKLDKNTNNIILGLDEFKDVSKNLTVNEKLIINKYLTDNIQKVCKPSIDYFNNIIQKMPDILNDTTYNKIIELEQLRRQKYINLLELKNKKCEYLKLLTEIIIGHSLQDKVEIFEAEFQQLYVKAESLCNIIKHAITSRTDHSLTAIKKIENYINNELKLVEASNDNVNK